MNSDKWWNRQLTKPFNSDKVAWWLIKFWVFVGTGFAILTLMSWGWLWYKIFYMTN